MSLDAARFGGATSRGLDERVVALAARLAAMVEREGSVAVNGQSVSAGVVALESHEGGTALRAAEVMRQADVLAAAVVRLARQVEGVSGHGEAFAAALLRLDAQRTAIAAQDGRAEAHEGAVASHDERMDGEGRRLEGQGEVLDDHARRLEVLEREGEEVGFTLARQAGLLADFEGVPVAGAPALAEMEVRRRAQGVRLAGFGRDIGRLRSGVAMAMAMGSTAVLEPRRRFALKAATALYEGRTSFAMQFGVRLSSELGVGGGFAYGGNRFGGRAVLRFAPSR